MPGIWIAIWNVRMTSDTIKIHNLTFVMGRPNLDGVCCVHPLCTVPAVYWQQAATWVLLVNASTREIVSYHWPISFTCVLLFRLLWQTFKIIFFPFFLFFIYIYIFLPVLLPWFFSSKAFSRHFFYFFKSLYKPFIRERFQVAVKKYQFGQLKFICFPRRHYLPSFKLICQAIRGLWTA